MSVKTEHHCSLCTNVIPYGAVNSTQKPKIKFDYSNKSIVEICFDVTLEVIEWVDGCGYYMELCERCQRERLPYFLDLIADRLAEKAGVMIKELSRLEEKENRK